MDIRLLVEISPNARVRAMEIAYTGTVTGSRLEKTLCAFFGISGQHWSIDGQPIEALTLGEPPLSNGATLIALATSGETPVATAAPLFLAEVLHGPDSRKTFPLSRGRWALGRHCSDLIIEDPSLAATEGFIDVQHSGIHFVSKEHALPITLEVPFRVGNSVLRVSQISDSTATFSVPPESEIDAPPPRSKLLRYAMIIMPLIIGLTIALLTGLWLILALSVGSSLLMTLHAASTAGETRKTRELIVQAANDDLDSSRGFSSNTSGTTLVLGQHTRVARVRGKNRDLEALPWIDAAPFVLRSNEIRAYLPHLPRATQRLALVHLFTTNGEVGVLLSRNDSQNYRQLVEPLLAHQHATPLFVLPTRLPEVMLCESLPPSAPSDAEIYTLTAAETTDTNSETETGIEGVHLDGISDSTYRKLLTGGAVNEQEHQNSSALATTSTIPFFAETRTTGSDGGSDIYFYAGSDPQTGAPLAYGLNTHGPHFLCAGTTGAGKSQFLRSALWSMALATPASRLSFILIDFKGGAGLGPLMELPHCLGAITDLDVSGLARTLKYLRADLLKRERAFHSAGVSSHADYLDYCHSLGKNLDFPKVVICIDEFKMLVDQHSTIMDELMRIAAIGRSLGYHLFLATQRPQGAVSPEIRANIATAFCLRVSSPQDSFNVIASEDAAEIPARCPGLGIAKDSENRLLRFQAPLIDGFYKATESNIFSIRYLSEDSGFKNGNNMARGLTDKEFTALCARIKVGSAPPPYLPIAPLPVPAPFEKSDKPLSLEVGHLEVPDIGIQQRWVWEKTDGSLLCLGSMNERTEHTLMLIEQALSKGCQVLCLSPSEQFVERVKERCPEPAFPCFAYSFRDFDFVRGVVRELGTSPTPTFLVLDSFEGIQDNLARYPEFEAHLLDLLAPIGDSKVKVLCTSAVLPRGKFHHIFENTLFSGSFLEHDHMRSHQKDYNRPLTGQFAVEGKIIQKLAGGTVDNGTLCFALPHKTVAAPPISFEPGGSLSQLPERLAPDALEEFAQGRRLLIGLDRKHRPTVLPELRNGFISVAGKKGSGKTTFLRSLMRNNSTLPSIFIPGEALITVEHLEKALAQQGKTSPLLCIDNLHLLPHEIQRFILESKESFSHVVIAYTPWPRWSTSPILSALSGTETGIVLAPESTADLSFYPDTSLPWDLRTKGRVPAGRGVLIDHGETLAFQTPDLPHQAKPRYEQEPNG